MPTPRRFAIASGIAAPAPNPGAADRLSPRAGMQVLDDVARLGNHLDPPELSSLYAYLLNRERHDDPRIQGLHRVVKNDVMGVLCRQRIPPPDLANVLIRCYRDQAQDPVVRDYALQHIRLWHPREPNPENRQRLIQTLWLAADSSDDTHPGTALLALDEILPREGPEREQLRHKIATAANNPKISPAARATAGRLDTPPPEIIGPRHDKETP